MEQGPTCQSRLPKVPTDDPNYRILKRHRTRYTHYYFYIRDDVLGPLIVCVGSFLPFQMTYYLNGHHFIEGELRRQGVRFRKDDNAFRWVSDPHARQAAADRLSATIIRKHKRLRGKCHSMLEKVDHGHHVLRVDCKSRVARLYEKFSTFLRIEICVNRMKDLGLNKGLDQLDALRQHLLAATDRLAGFEAELLNVHVDFPLFQRLALPIAVGHTRIPGIKIPDTRMMRLMEVLLHGGPQLGGWRTAQIHAAILAAFGLTAERYSLTQLRDDVRKLKAHGLLERIGRTYAYRLTEKGIRIGAMFILFHKRVCGPLANSLFHHRPEDRTPQPAKIERADHQADTAIQRLVSLLAA
jgi:hypothetical protein